MAQNFSGEIYCTIPMVKDFNNQNFSGEVKFNADYLDIESDAGFKFNNSQFQFTTRVFYMPQIINGFQIGGGVNYHF